MTLTLHTTPSTLAAREINAVQDIWDILTPLDHDSRLRVLKSMTAWAVGETLPVEGCE